MDEVCRTEVYGILHIFQTLQPWKDLSEASVLDLGVFVIKRMIIFVRKSFQFCPGSNVNFRGWNVNFPLLAMFCFTSIS